MSTNSPTHRITRGIGSCISLAGLLLGVPIVLAVLAGWPLPRSMPDPERIKAVLGSRAELPSATVVKAVAIVGWIAWLEISLAILVETTARLRRSSVVRLRLPGFGGAQTLAANLVAGVVLLVGTRQAGQIPQPLTAVVAASSTSPVAPALIGADSPPPVIADYTVVPGDWLSTIARDELGDVRRFPEIVALNRDRPQPDGRALTNPDLIRPGWKLQLPAAENTAAVSPPVGKPETAAPASGDASPAVCETALAVPAQAPNSEPGPASTTDPPVGTAGPGLSPAPGPASTSAPPPAPADPVSPPHGERDTSPVQALPAVIPAVLAGLAITRLAKLRANQQRHRRRGRTIPRPPAPLQEKETRIRAVADAEAPAWIDAATRRLWTVLESVPDVPGVIAVRAGSLGVELLLDRVAPVPPAGFVSADGGRTWRLDHHGDLAALETLTDGQSSVLPGLLYVGDTPEGPLWLNLDHAGTLSVEGQPDRVTTFLSAATVHLATAPWSDALDVLMVGGDQRLSGLDHVRTVTGAEAARELASSDDNECGNRLAARVAPPGLEALAPTVVLAMPGSLDAEETTKLAAAAQPDSGVALIGAGPIEHGSWRLDLDPDGSAVLHPLKIDLTFRCDEPTADAVIDLIAHAADHRDIALPAPEPEMPDRTDVGLTEPAIRIRILGPGEIDWAGAAPRTKAVEIVAYLATRDHPIQGDRLRVDLWPAPTGGEVADATFRTNISRARSALGLDEEGRPHLREAEHGAYRLGPHITTDWHRFRRHAALAQNATSDEAIEHYREALKLIRGAPFANTPKGAYHWIHGDGLVWEIETAVAEAAERFAELLLEGGEHRLADWAARQALKVTPHRETLYQLRMRAAHQAGDHDALERLYRELRLALRALGELEEPRPETVALFESLARCSSTHSLSLEHTMLRA